MKQALKIIVAVVLVLAVGWLLARVLTIAAAQEQSRADRAELYERLDRQRDELSDQQAASEALETQIRSLGEEPVVQSSARATTPEVRYLPIPGRDGEDGDDGADGERGRAGRDGVDGESITGPAGESIIGPQGPVGAPGPTGGTGNTGPQGPQGDRGATGERGTDGRGITSILCTSLTPIDLTITYSDGTTATISCNPVDPDPEPPNE